MKSTTKVMAWIRRVLSRPATSLAQRAIRRGNTARALGNWQEAAAGYRSAVQAEPGLARTWIQLGHALKESEDLPGALEAYRKAIALLPEFVETHVHIAHLYKRSERIEEAIQHFLKAFHGGLDATNEEDELIRLISRKTSISLSNSTAFLERNLRDLPPRDGEAPLLGKLRQIMALEIAPDAATNKAAAGNRSAIVFDVSDLIEYFRGARQPTGIQRVQLAAIDGALSRHDSQEVRLCCFIEERENWFELPLERMRDIITLATKSGDHFDPDWMQAMTDLRLLLSLAQPIVFPQGASLINLGTSWWLPNYFLFIRDAKAKYGIRYIPFVHDMIPVIKPEHCTAALTRDFIGWVIGVLDHADYYLVNSEATRKDLITVAGILGRQLDTSLIAVIPLDTDSRKEDTEYLGAAALDQWQLTPNGFVLFVSTIESRKGHLVAFDAWAQLIAKHGVDQVPQLVCVGNRGWLNDQIYERIATDEALSRKVTMLSRLSDAELALLYRSCRFTIYPSFYEGWGLPVTESLCYGKVPVVSDASSLPEAGGRFAVYANAGSALALAEQVERLIFDDPYRADLENIILDEFRPRGRYDLARQIVDELNRFVERHAAIVMPSPPMAQIGAWHPMKSNRETRIRRGMRTSEGFRSNLAWRRPEDRGCRIKPPGKAEMTFRLEGPHDDLRIFIELSGDGCLLSGWHLLCATGQAEGVLGPNERFWVAFHIPAADSAHNFYIQFDSRSDEETMAYFVRGFFIHAAHDEQTHRQFLEAVTLGRLETLAARCDMDETLGSSVC